MPYRHLNNVTILPCEETKIFKDLTPACYVLREIKVGMSTEIGLVKIDSFKKPELMLGGQDRIDKVFKTFQNRNKSTGVLFTGLKGTGKTLTAKEICRQGIEKYNLPVFIIDEYVPNLGQFLEMIDDEVIIFFDEFEKTYPNDEDKQDEILTLLDGIYEKKRLYLLTANRQRNLSKYLLNRPGRCYYNFEYEELEMEVIEEFCKLKLKDTAHLNSIKAASSLIKDFSFDILTTVVEQFNIFGTVNYDELNVEETLDAFSLYDIEVTLRKTGKVYKTCNNISPFSFNITVYLHSNEIEYGIESRHRVHDDDQEDDNCKLVFRRDDLKWCKDGLYHFETPDAIIEMQESMLGYERSLNTKVKSLTEQLDILDRVQNKESAK